MIRLGLVGAGAWGRNYVKAAEDSGAARVTSIAEHRHQWPRGVDAYVVAVHPRFAVTEACRALDEGKPVMVEKPAGLSERDALRLADAEVRSKGFVLVAHQHLFAQKMEDMRRVARESERVEARILFGGPGPARDYSAIWDYGPHAVSAALALIGSWVHMRFGPDPGEFAISNSNGDSAFCSVGNDWVGKAARVGFDDHDYDGYAPAEPALTRAVRAFAWAVAAGGAYDWRFGAEWAVRVARVLDVVISRT